MLRRIYVNNYRSLVNFDFAPTSANLLWGANGSGKSAFFEVIEGLRRLLIDREEVLGPFAASTFCRFVTDNLMQIQIEAEHDGLVEYTLHLEREGPNVYIRKEVLQKENRLLFRYEGGNVYLYNDQGKPGAEFPYRPDRSFLANIEPRRENTELIWFRDTFLANMWVLRLAPRQMEGFVAQTQTLRVDASNFVTWLQSATLDLPEIVTTLRELLAPMMPGLATLGYPRDEQGRRGLVLTFSDGEHNKGYKIGFEELSDGQRCLVVLYALVAAMPQTSILLVDEPDNYLGLSEVQPALVALRDHLGDKGQLLVASHHPEVIDYLAADASFVFERPAGGPTRVRAITFDAPEFLRPMEMVKDLLR